MAADLFKIKRYQWCCLSVWFVVQRNISFWKEILSWLNIQCPTSRMYSKFVRYKDNDDYKTSSRIYIANFVEQPTSGRYFKFVRGISNADYKISYKIWTNPGSICLGQGVNLFWVIKNWSVLVRIFLKILCWQFLVPC